MKPISSSLGAVLVLLGVGAFGPGPAAASELVPLACAQGDPPALAFEIDLVIGGNGESDDDGEVLIASVSRVVEDRRGGLFVADGGIPCIYKLDAGGGFIARYGRTGDGPGDLGFPFTIGIDAQDRLAVVRMGGHVSLMNSEWEVVGGFERRNPAGDPRSIVFLGDGGPVISASNLEDGTTIDRYSTEFEHLDSFGDTFCRGTDWPARFADSYAGGFLARDRNDELLYAQFAPYELRRFTKEGGLLAATREGAADFVPEPPRPEMNDGRMFLRMTAGASGVEALPDGRVLTSCWRRDEAEDGEWRTTSRLCLYGADFALLGRSDFEGAVVLRGCDRTGRLFLFLRTDEAQVVLRARLMTPS